MKGKECNEEKVPKARRSGGLLPLPPLLFGNGSGIFEDRTVAKSQEAGRFKSELAEWFFGFPFDHPDSSQKDIAFGGRRQHKQGWI